MPEGLLSNIKAQIKTYLDKGYTKSELARELEISRSTLVNLLNQNASSFSKSTLARIQSNLSWLKKSFGHELLECLILINFHKQNVVSYIKEAIDKAENATGYKAGYHGITRGNWAGFMFIQTPGADPVTEMVAKSPFHKKCFGRTETFAIGTVNQLNRKHDEAYNFLQNNPESKTYLKLFTNYDFSSVNDLHSINKKIIPYYDDSIFCLKSGLLTGRYDYFVLFMAKNEQSYRQFVHGNKGIYSITSKSLTDSTTLPILTGPSTDLFKDDNYNLSYNALDNEYLM